MAAEYVCRRCGSKQEEIACGDCETTVCVVCYERCRRCDKPLCDAHFERSEARGGICDGCLDVRRTYLEEGLRVFEAQREMAANAGAADLARIFKRARTILKDLERWSDRLERRRIELETLPDVRAEGLTRQIKELQQEEVKLHAARRAAEDAAAAKSRFVAHVSHEIRTPMNAVVAMADLLGETKLDDQQRKYLTAIRRSGEHLVRIVGDILDYSKFEAGRLSIESVPFDLEANLADVIDILAPRAQEKGIPVIFRYSPSAPRRVVGDPARIRQVIMNLVSNAIKFTHTGNVIVFVEQLGFAQRRAVMRMTVLDTGIGIPRDKYPAIFEQFEQANAGTYREYGGTGLGLAITNQLVLLMGGQVGLTSREGNGSRFRVTLAMPLADGEPAERGGAALAGRRILIADPNPTSAEFLAAQARHLGGRAVTVADRGSTLEHLLTALEQKEPFDAVWLHHMPPYLDAASLGAAIQSSDRIPRTMRVCFSSAGTPEQRSTFEALGFTACFHGPCLAADINRTLADAQQGFAAGGRGKMLFTSQSSGEDASDAFPEDVRALGRFRVLVIEDRPVNQEVAAALFEAIGCPVTILSTGEEAVEACANDGFDIVFMDCQLPGMDGYETSRRIRRLPAPAGSVPIVAMTAGVAEGYRERCLQAGMNDYIPKPATRQHIVSAMHRWLNPPQKSALEPVERPLPAMVEEPVLDREKALKTLGGRLDILQRIAAVFLDNVPQEAAALGAAVRNGSAGEVERLAHSIKTAALSLGGIRLSRIAEQLECAGHHGDAAQARAIHPDFDEEFAAFIRELQGSEWGAKT